MANDYRNRFVTPETAAKAVRSGDWVDYGFGAGFPELMDKALAKRKDELKDVKIRGGLVIRPRIEVVESDPNSLHSPTTAGILEIMRESSKAEGSASLFP